MANKILAGRYELIARIGDGGMAVVYKAKDRLLNRYVAIKILKPEYIRDPKFVDSFRRESQAAAGLSHPNVVSVYDVGKEGNIYYIVMELMEGDLLSDIIRKEAPLSERRVIDITRQVAAALSSAHKKNIIHRDVKPHNILFTADGTAKLTDFGIAKAVNSGTIVNTNTTVLGSVHYLSPEQARGGFVDAKSDIYSLGIVMYEMLTGSVPFDGENAVSVAMMHINGMVPAPSLENPVVSPLMDAIVLKAVARQPGERFSSADELIAALANAADGISMSVSGATTVYGVNEIRARERMQQEAMANEVHSLEDLMGDDYNYSSSGSMTGIGGQNGMNSQYMSGNGGGLVQGDGNQPVRRRKRVTAEERRKIKLSKILGIVLALICALPLSLFILNSCDGSGSKTIPVPNVIGMTEEQAAEELRKSGLEYKLGLSAISDTYEAGLVISTDPDPGDKVKSGYTVELILSRGGNENTVKVPTLVGKKLREAETLLKSYDLKKGNVTYESSDMPEGTVINQTPEAGTEVDLNTEISLVISQGKEEELKVPDLSGLTESQAKKTLEEMELKLGRVSKSYSDKEKGTVISQSKEAGSEASKGDTVGITISDGPEPKSDPVDIPLTIDYDDARNEVFTLTVTVTDSNGLHYVVNNQSRIKSDGGETLTLSGTGSGSVRVIMDNEIVYEATANFDTGVLS